MIVVRDVLRVAGPDALSFLQGQLSQDLDAIPAGGSAWSLVLQPQGKVDAFVRVTRVAGDEFLLDVDGGFGDALVARLDRFKLRVNADLELLGPRAVEVADDADPAAPLGAFRQLPGQEPQEVTESDPRVWDEERVRLGLPAMGRELTEDTIPEEAGVVDVAVSFTKGCYTGQELVARIDSRGRNVPRRLRRLVMVGDGELHAGDDVTVGGKAVGRVTTAAGRAALGYVSRAIEPPAECEVNGQVARIEALPPLR